MPPTASCAKALQDLNWRQYVTRSADGDQSAFAALYDESSKLVYSIILLIVRSPEDAEEVTLDVYTTVWNNACRYDQSRGSVCGWLVLLARSRAIDRVRSKSWKYKSSDQPDLLDFVATGGESPEAQLLEAERRHQLRIALMTLAPEERELLLLAFFRGHTHRELAERLQQPLGTVKTRIRTAMIKLRNRLSPCGEPSARLGFENLPVTE